MRVRTTVSTLASEPFGSRRSPTGLPALPVDWLCGGVGRPTTSTARKYKDEAVSLGGLEVSRIGLGAMTMAGTYTSEGALDDSESIRTIHRALDLGVTHIDTAEVYGPFHSEEVVGRAIKGRRDQVVIATKFGLVSHADGEHPGVWTAVRPTSASQWKAPCVGSGPTTSTSTTSTVLTRTPRSRRPQAPLPAWLPRARSSTSAYPKPAPRPSVEPTLSTRCPRCRPSTRSGRATRRRDPAAASRARHRLRPILTARTWAAHRPDSLRRRLRRRRLAQDEPAVHRRELRPEPRHRR